MIFHKGQTEVVQVLAAYAKIFAMTIYRFVSTEATMSINKKLYSVSLLRLKKKDESIVCFFSYTLVPETICY